MKQNLGVKQYSTDAKTKIPQQRFNSVLQKIKLAIQHETHLTVSVVPVYAFRVSNLRHLFSFSMQVRFIDLKHKKWQ